MSEYQGEERRSEYCPVHHIKCDQWDNTEKKVSSRVPIWIFIMVSTAFMSSVGVTATWLNIASIERHEHVVTKLTEHVDSSNRILTNNSIVLGRATHALNEVVFNQQRVIDQLKMEFQPLPDYNIELPE